MDNLEMMRKRLEWQGGIHQEDRMIKGKWRTLNRVLKYSYQACSVQMVQQHAIPLNSEKDQIDQEMNIFPIFRALINPDKVKQDYDDKILSIDYGTGYQPGDIFEWKKTGTHWIIYTEEITEDAYFRGNIRRCKYRIKFRDKNGNWKSTWAAIRGPVETQIESIQKNQQRIDKPNLSLNILIPQNEDTLYAFDRYAEFLFAERAWKVKAPDSISMRNIIEVNAEEDYINKDTDDIAEGMKNGLIIEPVDKTPDSKIKGESFIKPKIQEIYSVEDIGGKWKVLEDDAPVVLSPYNDKSVRVTWNKSTHGQFTLQWIKDNDIYEKYIVVESLY